MSIAYFASFLFNLLVILVPLAALTAFFTVGALRKQGSKFWNYAPYTLAGSVGLTGGMLALLGSQLRANGVYALLPFAPITQRPAILVLVVIAVSLYILGSRSIVTPRQAILAKHVAIALALSAATQCAIALFLGNSYFRLANVPVNY